MTTFSTSLKLELIGDGQQSGTWGQTTNKNLGTLLEQAITGVQSITMLDANYTLTNLNGVSDEARNAVIVATGTNSAIRDIIAPLVNKIYLVSNQTVGGFAIRIRGGSGTSVTVPNGVSFFVYCDGVNFYTATNGAGGNFNIAGNETVAGTLSVTGAINGTTAAFSGAISSVSPAFTGVPTAPTALAGTNTNQIATTAFATGAASAAFPSGGIIMWSGSIASIPSGWKLCDGTNGTPNLKDRFIVGAGGAYGVGNTGGSADAVVVSHTHTASVTDPGHNHQVNNFGATFPSGGGGSVNYASNGYGGLFNTTTSTTGISVSNSTTGVSGTNANLPPYYALAYIQKA